MTAGRGGTLQSPLGPISATETDGRITNLDWRASAAEPAPCKVKPRR